MTTPDQEAIDALAEAMVIAEARGVRVPERGEFLAEIMASAVISLLRSRGFDIVRKE